ncbi:hypothetical protein MAR_001258 [Mya arenaria]|uniref:Uncharacterized protein n=1 Tax=Mya arenaria TaxID=6604 RepID=A0ABY7FBB1_MYAAR|nr:hypothetical protein MAR_001258 [Mya arenaria]
MIERGFCADDMGGLINTNAQQMSGFQNPYSGSGHFSQMYPSSQRPSFAIQELLGLSNPTCRQNVSPDILESQAAMSSGNFMYFSRDLPMYNPCAGNYNPSTAPAPVHQEPMGQAYVNVSNVRDSLPPPSHQSNSTSPFCPWRVPESLTQTTMPNQHMHVMPPMMSRTADGPMYNYKMSPNADHNVLAIDRNTGYGALLKASPVVVSDTCRGALKGL